MSRTIERIPYNGDFKTVKSNIEQLLAGSGFTLTPIQTGETVWKKGTGLMTAIQFIKIEYGSDSITVSGWVSTGLGTFAANEMSLDGFTAIAAKKPVKQLISQLKQIIS